MKFYLFDRFKVKTRILQKRQRRASSPRQLQNLKQLGYPLALEIEMAKKRSTMAYLNKYTTKLLSYFVIKDKNLIRKKSSKIDQSTNPRYLKLRVDHKKEFDATSKDEVMELSAVAKLEKEKMNLEIKKKKQQIIYCLKKNKNYFLDLLRDLNKNNQNCIKPVGEDAVDVFSPLSRKNTSKKISAKPSRRVSQQNTHYADYPETFDKVKNSPNSLEKAKDKTHLALIPSNRMRISALMKVKMSTQIDDNEAYILTFKSSPSSNSRSMSKSQTHTYSILGHSGSKVADNSTKNSIGMVVLNKIRTRNFKMNEPEYIFLKALINAQIDMEDMAEKEKYVEESMNYKQKYLNIIVKFNLKTKIFFSLRHQIKMMVTEHA